MELGTELQMSVMMCYFRLVGSGNQRFHLMLVPLRIAGQMDLLLGFANAAGVGPSLSLPPLLQRAHSPCHQSRLVGRGVMQHSRAAVASLRAHKGPPAIVLLL